MVRAASMTIGGSSTLACPPLVLSVDDEVRRVMCLVYPTRVDVFDAEELLASSSTPSAALGPPESALLASLPTSGWPLVAACRVWSSRLNADRLLLLDEAGVINIIGLRTPAVAGDGPRDPEGSDDEPCDVETRRLIVRTHGCITVDSKNWPVPLPPSLANPAANAKLLNCKVALHSNPSATLIVIMRATFIALFDPATKELHHLRTIVDATSAMFTDDRTLVVMRSTTPTTMTTVTVSSWGRCGERMVVGMLPASPPKAPGSMERLKFEHPGALGTVYSSSGCWCFQIGSAPSRMTNIADPACSHEIALATVAQNSTTFILTNRRVLQHHVNSPRAVVVAVLPSDLQTDFDSTSFSSIEVEPDKRECDAATRIIVACESSVAIYAVAANTWRIFWLAGRGTCCAADSTGRVLAGSLSGVVRRFAKGAQPEVIAEVVIAPTEAEGNASSSHQRDGHVDMAWLPSASSIVAKGVLGSNTLRITADGIESAEIHPSAISLSTSSSSSPHTRAVLVSASEVRLVASTDDATTTCFQVFAFRDAIDVVRDGTVVGTWSTPSSSTEGGINLCASAVDGGVAVAQGTTCTLLAVRPDGNLAPVASIELGRTPAAMAVLPDGVLLLSFFDAPNQLSAWRWSASSGAVAGPAVLHLHTKGAQASLDDAGPQPSTSAAAGGADRQPNTSGGAVVVSLVTSHEGDAHGVVAASTSRGHLWIIYTACHRSNPVAASSSANNNTTVSNNDNKGDDEEDNNGFDIASIALPSLHEENRSNVEAISTADCALPTLWAWLLDGSLHVAPIVALGPAPNHVAMPDYPTGPPASYIAVLAIVPGLAATQYVIGCEGRGEHDPWYRRCRGREVCGVPLASDVEEMDLDVRSTEHCTTATAITAFGEPSWALSSRGTVTIWGFVTPAAAVTSLVTQLQIAPRGNCIRAVCAAEAKPRSRFAVVSQPQDSSSPNANCCATLHLIAAWNPNMRADSELLLEGAASPDLDRFDALTCAYDTTLNIIVVGGARLGAVPSAVTGGLLVVVAVDPLRIANVIVTPEPVLSLSASGTGAMYAAMGKTVSCWRSSDLARPMAEWLAAADGGALFACAAPDDTIPLQGGGASFLGEYHCLVGTSYGLRALRLVMRDDGDGSSPGRATSASMDSTNGGGTSAGGGGGSSPPRTASTATRFALLAKDPMLSGADLVALFATELRLSFKKVFAAVCDMTRGVNLVEVPVSGTDVTSRAVRKIAFGASLRFQTQPVGIASADRRVLFRAGSASMLTPMPLSCFEAPIVGMDPVFETLQSPGDDEWPLGNMSKSAVATFLRRTRNRDGLPVPSDNFCICPLGGGVILAHRDGTVTNLIPLGSRLTDVLSTLEQRINKHLDPRGAPYDERGVTTSPSIAINSANEDSRRQWSHARTAAGVAVVNVDTLQRAGAAAAAVGTDGYRWRGRKDSGLWNDTLQPTLNEEYPLLTLMRNEPLRGLLTSLHALCS